MKLNPHFALPVVAVAFALSTASIYQSTVKNARSQATRSSGHPLQTSCLSSPPVVRANTPTSLSNITGKSHPRQIHSGDLLKILEKGTRSEVFDALAALAGPSQSRTCDIALLSAEFTSPMSTVALDALADLLAGTDTEAPSPHVLPVEVADGIRKGFQSQQDQARVGQALERAWLNASPEGRQRLEAQEIPEFFAIRTATVIADEPGEALLWMARLETCAHPSTPESVLALALNPALSIAELSSVLYNWSQNYSMPETSLMLNHAMTDPTRNMVQRGISALGLAGTSDSLSHVPAMEKAASTTNHAWLQSTLNYAVKLAQENMQLR